MPKPRANTPTSYRLKQLAHDAAVPSPAKARLAWHALASQGPAFRLSSILWCCLGLRPLHAPILDPLSRRARTPQKGRGTLRTFVGWVWKSIRRTGSANLSSTTCNLARTTHTHTHVGAEHRIVTYRGRELPGIVRLQGPKFLENC